LEQLGFISSKGGTSLFFYRKRNITIFVLVYVDDIIVASSSQEATTALLRDPERDFSLKDLGDLNYFLAFKLNETKMDWYFHKKDMQLTCYSVST
jgi:histone deacetylase 1/2